MAVFKRFEVWVLLLFVAGGIAFVLFTQKSAQLAEAEDPVDPLTPVVQEQTAFQIEHARLRQEDPDNWLLELSVRYENESTADLELVSPSAQLLTASGDEVPRFFLAFSPPPVVPAQKDGVVELRYWLSPQHRASKLWLEILNERVEVQLEPLSASTVQ